MLVVYTFRSFPVGSVTLCSAFINSYFATEPTKVTIYSLLKDIFVFIEAILGRLHSFLTRVSGSIIISQRLLLTLAQRKAFIDSECAWHSDIHRVFYLLAF